MIFFLNKIPAYPNRAPNTNSMHERIQADRALKPSTLGEVAEIVLKVLISTKKRIIKSDMRPGTTSGSIKKLTCIVIMQDIIMLI